MKENKIIVSIENVDDSGYELGVSIDDTDAIAPTEAVRYLVDAIFMIADKMSGDPSACKKEAVSRLNDYLSEMDPKEREGLVEHKKARLVLPFPFPNIVS